MVQDRRLGGGMTTLQKLTAQVSDLRELEKDVVTHAYTWLVEQCGKREQEAYTLALGVADEIRERAG